MKMDAMQKRKMWKAAAGHFALTVFSVVLIFSIPFGPTSSFQDFRLNFGDTLFSFLQPQLYFVSRAYNLNSLNHFTWDILFISVPTWSICFGWIYVKFTNWLNHIPVLGKRVFLTKMDATQKQKIRKVAKWHLGLTCFIPVLIASSSPALAVSKGRFLADPSREAWIVFLLTVLILLQPIAAFLFMKAWPLFGQHFVNIRPDWFFIILFGTFFLFICSTVPLWSYCFSWIFVKLDNWLSHFPILGKRVF